MIEYMSLRLCAEDRERFRRSPMVLRGDSLVVSVLRRNIPAITGDTCDLWAARKRH
jgi:hypothetical protein